MAGIEHHADAWDIITDFVQNLHEEGECAIPHEVDEAINILDGDLFMEERQHRDEMIEAGDLPQR